jgi:CBS domain-containing protein
MMATRVDAVMRDVDGAHVDGVSVQSDASVLDALSLMLDANADAVAVIDDGGRRVGVITQADVLRVRARHLEHERIQPGWISSYRRRAP